MVNEKQPTIWGILAKTAVVHTITYGVVGLVVFSLFNYSAMLAEPAVSAYMRSASDPLVKAGLLFQPVRGLLFGFVFYLLRDVVFGRKNGWLILWANLVVVGILSTFAPAGWSIEGLIYMQPSAAGHLGGLVEILSQSCLLSALICFWVNHAEKKWLGWVLGILFVVLLLLPVLGILASR